METFRAFFVIPENLHPPDYAIPAHHFASKAAMDCRSHQHHSVIDIGQTCSYHSQIILAGRKVNDGMGQFVAESAIRQMILSGMSPRNMNVAILGFTFKENCNDLRNTKVKDIYDHLFLLTRYLLGAFYRPVPIDMNFTPGVTIIIPCFNEEQWIARTIRSCVNQDYPIDKLEILVVDDCSTDGSVEEIRRTIQELERDNARFRIGERVRLIVQEKNGGKREALSAGALQAQHELLVFVDSDSFLDMFAIRNLVQPFRDPKMGGVSGRTDVANAYTNGLNKMQAVRYYIAFRIMKAAESVFDTVTCLSGPLSCYRKDIVLENLSAWRNQKFLGQRATFGDDRSMTNFVLRHHRTAYQDNRRKQRGKSEPLAEKFSKKFWR